MCGRPRGLVRRAHSPGSMRPIVVGEPSSRATLQRVAHKPQGVRTEHEVFVNWANDSIAGSLAESSQILRDLGEDPAAAIRGERPRVGSPSRQNVSPRRGASPVARGRAGMSPVGRGAARSASPSVAYTATVGAPASAGMVLSETMAQEASLGRARSARDLFAALSDGTGALADGLQGTAAALQDAYDQRVISVREFQRGTAVVKPAKPLPFPGPDSLSPGERKRAQAAARAAGREKIPPMGARGAPQPTLADGVTTMLTGVRGDLGEILTAPVSPFSSFDNLLDRLVDTPEACFVNPSSLPWSSVVIAGRAAQPAAHKQIRGAFSFRT